MLKVILIGALVLASSVSAGAQWTTDGRPVDASDAHKIKDGLAAYLVLVPRPIKVLEDFSSAPLGQVPSLALVDRVSDGEEFGAVVLIAGCDQLGSDECRLTVTFAVLRPDGTPYTGGTNLSRPAEPPLAGTGSRPATSFLKLKLSVQDPRGLYQVSAKVSDATRGITLDLKTSVLLEESLPAASARPN